MGIPEDKYTGNIRTDAGCIQEYAYMLSYLYLGIYTYIYAGNNY